MMTEHPTASPALRRHVVVGFNGKEHSRRALHWAADEAVRYGAPLLVVFAANYPGMTVDPLEPGALETDERVTAQGVAEAVAAQPGLQVDGSTEVTSPSQALSMASALATMVVIGTRGHGRLGGALLGSVGFRVAARAVAPVVVVKGEPDVPSPGGPGRVVVGTDGSPEADTAVTFAAERAHLTSGTLQIVTCTGEHPVADVDPASLRRRAQSIAADAADRVRTGFPGLSVTTRVEDAPAERTLVDASEGAEMVVVGTRGRGAFAGMLLGSVSHAVIHGAHCPVAVV
jgi:nucleotide-binding universal stress UspA family protein